MMPFLLLAFSACGNTDDDMPQNGLANGEELTYKGVWAFADQRVDGTMKVSATQFQYPDFPMPQLLSVLFPERQATSQTGTYGMEYTLQGTSDKAAYYLLRDNVWQAEVKIDGNTRTLRLNFITLPLVSGFHTGNQATYSSMSDSYMVTLRLTSYELVDANGVVDEQAESGLTLTFSTRK